MWQTYRKSSSVDPSRLNHLQSIFRSESNAESGGDILTTILSVCDNSGDEKHKLKGKKTDEKGFGRTYNNLINIAKLTIPDHMIFL